jgi:plasmid stability protein
MWRGRENGDMNTTVDLPDALASEIKRRAVQEGRRLDDVVADVLRAGMTPAAESGNGQLVSKTLPLIKVRPAQPANPMALSQQEWCDWIKQADMQLEVEHYEKALGHQHVDRVDPRDARAARPRP